MLEPGHHARRRSPPGPRRSGTAARARRRRPTRQRVPVPVRDAWSRSTSRPPPGRRTTRRSTSATTGYHPNGWPTGQRTPRNGPVRRRAAAVPLQPRPSRARGVDQLHRLRLAVLDCSRRQHRLLRRARAVVDEPQRLRPRQVLAPSPRLAWRASRRPPGSDLQSAGLTGHAASAPTTCSSTSAGLLDRQRQHEQCVASATGSSVTLVSASCPTPDPWLLPGRTTRGSRRCSCGRVRPRVVYLGRTRR